MEKVQTRVGKSLKNTVFGVAGMLCSLLVSFATKSVFVRLLGAEYNGVDGLFSNILQVLNLAELGFAASVAYALYKPLKEGNERTTAALMNYFAKTYRIIAAVVAVAGCCCIPLLQYLIAEDISELSFSLNELRGYFAMYLASTVCSYLLAYKRTIITADQNNYIVTNVDYACNIMLNVLQIILLLIYKNFYAFLAIMIAKTIINNLILHIIAGKKYPYLKLYKKEKLSHADKSAIFKNVQAAFLHRIGGVIIFSTTSIVISAFVSLIEAGMYSNYIMVVNGINNFVNIIFTSITASIGNLCVNENEDVQYAVFKKIQYMSCFCAFFTFVCFVALFNPFIEIWVGADMMMPMSVVFAISFSAMIGYLRKAVNTFKDAKGMFRNDWWKPLVEASAGVALAIGLSYVWGTFGVIIGYSVATVVIAIPTENWVLFKQGLHKPFAKQMLLLVGTVVFAFASAAAAYLMTMAMPSGVGWFILRLLICVVFAAGIFILATIRTQEFKYYKLLAVRVLSKVFGKSAKKKASVTVEGAQSIDEPKSIDRENENDGSAEEGAEQKNED